MKIPRNTKSMLISSTIASFLSGLMAPLIFGPRAALFGCALTFTVILVRKYGWTLRPFLPAIVAGLLIELFPFDPFGSDMPLNYQTGLTALNCTITIPAMAYSYLRPRRGVRIGCLLAVGLLSSALRMLSLEWTLGALSSLPMPFVVGMLPFIIFWTGAMRLSDPGMSPPFHISLSEKSCAENSRIH